MIGNLLAFAAVAAVLLTLLGAALAVWWYSPPERLRRRLAAVPSERTGRAAGKGTVRMVGLAEATSALTSPMLEQPCLAYELQVQSRGLDDRWHTILEERSCAPFVLHGEGEHRVHVDVGSDCQLMFERRALAVDLPWRSGTDALAALLRERGLARSGARPSSRLRFAELCLPDRERVAVIGRVHEEADPEAPAKPGYRAVGRPAKRSVIRAGGVEPVVISDERELMRRDRS